jgi:hypothetical protein
MRKLVAAVTLSLVLAGTASAAEPRGPRDRETPIVRVFKAIKRLLNPSAQNWPTVPIP